MAAIKEEKPKLATVALPADYVHMIRTIASHENAKYRDVIVRCSSENVQKEYARVTKAVADRLKKRQANHEAR